MVEIKDVYNWKTTSTKDLSTKCKFELAKKHLRNLIITQPELFMPLYKWKVRRKS